MVDLGNDFPCHLAHGFDVGGNRVVTHLGLEIAGRYKGLLGFELAVQPGKGPGQLCLDRSQCRTGILLHRLGGFGCRMPFRWCTRFSLFRLRLENHTVVDIFEVFVEVRG